MVLVIVYTPFARVFGFESFEARHGSYHLDLGIYLVIWLIVKMLYLKGRHWPADQMPPW